MTTPGNDPQDDESVGPLGSAVSEPARPGPGAGPHPAKDGEDGAVAGADGMAGPVYPPPETEPDAHGSD